ncbi:MAG: imidazole glycerol phosphate synthase subunit HisH [Defluviitaleaceae bacterium]|nr:imidazole glycerol phosphate synthase subunit HisH [Defluviitaleaceae bacterium]
MIRIIDYKAGNAPSVMHAVKHLGFEAKFARQAKDFGDATHIILPGVGSAKATMDSLMSMNLPTKLEKMVLKRKIPFLGICVGMQILFEYSQEDDVPCLGWLKGRVLKYDTNNVRVPQMGWNQVCFTKPTPIETQQDDHYYFVNSYYAKPEDTADIWATSEYGGEFCAAINQENIYGTQFHVEKSGEAGLSLLKGFLSLERDK